MYGSTPILVGYTRKVTIEGLGIKTHILLPRDYFEHYYEDIGVEVPNYVDGVTVVEARTAMSRLVISYDPEETRIGILFGR